MNTDERVLAASVDALERRFGNFVAVNKVSFDVRRGEIFGFLGPNGAGKSTTIRMMTGILAPSGGRGTVAGFVIRTQAEQIKTQVGYMSQRFSLCTNRAKPPSSKFGSYPPMYGSPFGATHNAPLKSPWMPVLPGR